MLDELLCFNCNTSLSVALTVCPKLAAVKLLFL